jgi:hypothetical protein
VTLQPVDESTWGLSAARSRMSNVVDPPGKELAWDKFFPSFAQDVRNGNELIARVKKLEALEAKLDELLRRPW